MENETTTGGIVTYAGRIQTAALMIALIAVGAVIAIPVPGSPVPIVLQNAFVVLTGVVLSPLWAATTVAVYLGMGAVGLPVFAGATGGVAHFAGPTGGFLIGFLVAAPVVAAITAVGRDAGGPPKRIPSLLGVAVGLLLPYLTGVPWLASVADISFPAAIAVGALPFLIGDAVKLVVVLVAIRSIPHRLWQRFR